MLDERDEQEIETRLRAALLARSEMVSHANLRPGVPPNAHTAGLKNRESRWGFITGWRQLLVPVTVAAALAGGIFVGAALPDNSGHSSSASAAASGGATSAPVSKPPQSSAPTAASSSVATAGGITFGGLTFQAAGWSLTALDAGSACLAPKNHAAPVAGAALPCGVDALYIKTGATPGVWPLSGATDKTGWWPRQVSAMSLIPCPGASGSADVAASVLLRSTDKFTLADGSTAKYKEWMVACTDGSGAVPRLWQIGTTQPVALAAVSVNPSDDGALLAIVGSAHTAQ